MLPSQCYCINIDATVLMLPSQHYHPDTTFHMLPSWCYWLNATFTMLPSQHYHHKTAVTTLQSQYYNHNTKSQHYHLEATIPSYHHDATVSTLSSYCYHYYTAILSPGYLPKATILPLPSQWYSHNTQNDIIFTYSFSAKLEKRNRWMVRRNSKWYEKRDPTLPCT